VRKGLEVRVGVTSQKGAGCSGDSWSVGGWNVGGWRTDGWSGAGWSGAGWSGAGWSGAGWSGDGWSGDGWSGDGWSGDAWRGGIGGIDSHRTFQIVRDDQSSVSWPGGAVVRSQLKDLPLILYTILFLPLDQMPPLISACSLDCSKGISLPPMGSSTGGIAHGCDQAWVGGIEHWQRARQHQTQQPHLRREAKCSMKNLASPPTTGTFSPVSVRRIHTTDVSSW
jgi:hypothetical protein